MQLSSSITTMPPEPMIEPSLPSDFEINRGIEHIVRNAAPGGPAGLHRLDAMADRGCHRPMS